MIVTRSDYATGLGKGVARRSRDGEEQAAEKGAKMQRRSSFYIRRLPPYPPSRRGATIAQAFGRGRGYPAASTLKICVILSGALCAESNLEGVHREAWRHLLPSRDLVGSPPKPSGDTPREWE